MSEWWAFVACTCYREGLTTQPPYPPEQLTTNEFGIVTLKTSSKPGDDPQSMYDWRQGLTRDESRLGTACEHESMRVIEEVFYWPGATAHTVRYPTIEHALAEDSYPHLRDALYRPEGHEYPSGVWVRAAEATSARQELERLRAKLPHDLDHDHDDAYFVATLDALLKASADTGNPIVTHHNSMIAGAW